MIGAAQQRLLPRVMPAPWTRGVGALLPAALPVRTLPERQHPMETLLPQVPHVRPTPISPARLLTTAAAPRCGTVAGAVGNTPVLWIDHPPSGGGRGFWAKLEAYNPGGMKDRPALHMVEQARRRGELRAGGPVIESTSGTLGLGLALAGIAYGHSVTLVTDPGSSRSCAGC